MSFSRLYLVAVFAVLGFCSRAQDPWMAPTDSLVAQKLEWWKDQRFGLLMHWGPYSQWGVVESWSICSEDEDWCQRTGPYAQDYTQYKKHYEALPATFNPIHFQPEKWARAAADAGMKYMVFTTKHHDGFCMYDTRQTNYRITDKSCAFASNPHADVTAEIFNAFRKQGLGIGAYFSKPDWHNPDYWWPYFATPDRNVNYDPERYPEKWKSFCDFTYNQIEELMTRYGPVDILWLDGGWVRPRQMKNPEWVTSPYVQDIGMERIANMARQHQPGILVVDRSVGGEYENYITPEQQIPDSVLDIPWETCMPMATSWSYVENDQYKSTREIIHNLCQIVGRGGNYLLNIAPSPSGDWDSTAYVRLKEVGNWMRVNGEAIYGTDPMPGYGNNKRFFLRKGPKTIYVICLLVDRESLPPHIKIAYNGSYKKITFLGFSSKITAIRDKDKIDVQVPDEVHDGLKNAPAFVIRIDR